MHQALLDRFRTLCLSLPEAREVEAWGSPTFRVKTIFATCSDPGRYGALEGGSAWIKSDITNQELLVARAEGAVVALITRGEQVIPPRGSSQLLVDDHVFVVMKPEARAPVDAVFCRRTEAAPMGRIEFPLTGNASVLDLRDFYGIALDAEDDTTLNDLLCDHLGQAPRVGDEMTLGGVRLRVLDVSDDRIESVGLSVPGFEASVGGEPLRASVQEPPK